MAKPPFFPFFHQDFLNGTRFFTDAQTGCYIKLLLDQWDLEILKEKHFTARMNGFTEEECSEIRAKFKPVCVKNIEGFQNERMENTRKYVAKIGKIRSKSGKLGGRPSGKQKDKQNESKEDSKEDSKTKANQGIQILNSNTNLNIKSKIKDSLSAGKKTIKKKPPSFPWPEDFVLTIHLMDYATKQGIPDPVEEFENFRLNAISKSYVYADWSAAWMKWCRDDRTSKKPKQEEGGYG